MDTQARTVTSPAEALLIVSICFGWAILFSNWPWQAQGVDGGRGFSNGGMLFNLVIELVCATVALKLLHRRGFAIASLRPVPSWQGAGRGILLLLVGYAVAIAVVWPWLGADMDSPIDAIMQASSVSLPTITAFALVNGTFEEVFLLGFLLRGLRGYGLLVALAVSLLVRASYHTYQGPLGLLQVLALGLVFSLYYMRSNQIFPVVVAHVLADILPFVFE